MDEITPGIPQLLIDHAIEARIDTLVETGYHTGDTVEKSKDHFKHIYSIELSLDLYKTGKVRWGSWGHIHIIHGDSGKELKRILDQLDRRALIWLDAHWSGPATARGELVTPIKAELDALRLAPRRDHIIAIDDLQEFNGQNDYPTLPQLVVALQEINPSYQITTHQVRRGVMEARI